MDSTGKVIPLPRHLDRNLTELGRLHPSRVSMELQMTGLSTARMELTAEDGDVQPGEFMELFWIQGSAGIFRVTPLLTSCTVTPSPSTAISFVPSSKRTPAGTRRSISS